MNEPNISFHAEEIDFSLSSENTVQEWLIRVAQNFDKEIDILTYIFCSDSYLHKINREYLQHDTLTDIITFPYRQDEILSADIFISIDRVKENAEIYQVSFDRELARVMVHGLLHLCGLMDGTYEEKLMMREAEDTALSFIL